MFKTYWNDPAVLREKHEEFLKSDFRTQYEKYGTGGLDAWEKFLRSKKHH